MFFLCPIGFILFFFTFGFTSVSASTLDSVCHEASWSFFSLVLLLCFRLVGYTYFSDYPARLPAFRFIHHYRLGKLQ